MLILIAAVAILASLGIEEVIHRLKNSFEIEWPVPDVEPKNALALEVVARLRLSERKPERQMNRLFKVASGATW